MLSLTWLTPPSLSPVVMASLCGELKGTKGYESTMLDMTPFTLYVQIQLRKQFWWVHAVIAPYL
ncbi:unnamed protein product [Cylicostephanus goldi]|uniref:Uncharacterized protein n=1 Tax=Cylicostephanus goldi TaxID=71465 RepID=A0A3P6TR43_CYLGO|nr:unnamed protein product [Cylicostephanus goldi]